MRVFFLPSLDGGGAGKTMLRIANYLCGCENEIFLMLLNRSNTDAHENAYDFH